MPQVLDTVGIKRQVIHHIGNLVVDIIEVLFRLVRPTISQPSDCIFIDTEKEITVKRPSRDTYFFFGIRVERWNANSFGVA